MQFSEIKFGQKYIGKYSGITIIVTRTDKEFLDGRGLGTIFAVNSETGTEIAYRFDTFADYYEPLVEVKTICQRYAAGYDTNGNRIAIWVEFDALRGDTMAVMVEHNGRTPERLYGVPQLPDMGSSAKNIRQWIALAKTSETILFFA